MCISPIMLKKETPKQFVNDSYRMQEVPCGKCIECMKLRVNSWFIRLMNELKHCESAYFITMTYDDFHLPYTENGNMNLNYRDVQLFMKKLRKLNNEKTDKKIKYFVSGEYGENTHRPHYHMVIFNVADVDFIHRCWIYGGVHVGKVEEKSIYYTLKYTLKRAHKGVLDPLDDRANEKALMSKKLGIKFLTDSMIKYFKDDVTRPVTYLDNKKLPLPRYYRDKLFTDSEKRARNIGLLHLRDEALEKKLDPLYTQRVQAKIDKSKNKLKKTD